MQIINILISWGLRGAIRDLLAVCVELIFSSTADAASSSSSLIQHLLSAMGNGGGVKFFDSLIADKQFGFAVLRFTGVLQN